MDLLLHQVLAGLATGGIYACLALAVTRNALILNRGRVALYGPSAELLADPARLASLVMAQ